MSVKSKKAVLAKLYAAFHPDAPYGHPSHKGNCIQHLINEGQRRDELPYGGARHTPTLERNAADAVKKTQELMDRLANTEGERG